MINLSQILIPMINLIPNPNTDDKPIADTDNDNENIPRVKRIKMKRMATIF